MMTAAEAYAAEIYKDEPDNFHTDEQLCETINDFCAGWRAADNSRWIHVKDELPVVGETVQIYVEDLDDVVYGALQLTGDWWCEEYGCNFSNITYWMRKPAAPRKEDKNDNS